MPAGEDDEIARALKISLIGRLIPMGKFCLLANDGIHYTDGIAHAGYLEGKADPTVSVDFAQKKPKALWVNPARRPWRELTSLLQFIDQDKTGGFETLQLKFTLKRVSRIADPFALWSGGLRVSSRAGEQYPSGTDDYIQSEIWLSPDLINSQFLAYLKHEMAQLDAVQTLLYRAVSRYFGELLPANKSIEGNIKLFIENQAKKTTALFWQLCERQSQALINACDSIPEARLQRILSRKTFASYAILVFDQMCPNDSARQMDAWAQARPNLSNYLLAD